MEKAPGRLFFQLEERNLIIFLKIKFPAIFPAIFPAFLYQCFYFYLKYINNIVLIINKYKYFHSKTQGKSQGKKIAGKNILLKKHELL
jgi:hypothetical protein